MEQHRGLSWDHKTGRSAMMITVIAMVASLFAAAAGPAVATTADAVPLIVREITPSSDVAETLVERLGGAVTANLEIIGGFAASIPVDAIETITSSPAVLSVTNDRAATDLGAGWQDASALGEYDPNLWNGSMFHMGYQMGVNDYWANGYRGSGIGIALIDTGVVPVEGLLTPGKIVNGPDLSFESQSEAFRHLDTYGHGTHLAGIIAGRDSTAPAHIGVADAANHHLGAAPDAHIVSVKVAGHDGAVDVSQVIAAIDWVVQHKDDHNIRIINLSYGTDSTQDPQYDPLSYAVEQAWKHGLLVVVASGNDGNGSAVRNPATNPYVLTVGALDGDNIRGKNAQPIPEWSSCGTDRTVDLVAPGTSIVSLRNPGSTADTDHPEARVAGRFFLGSGTSQAAAAAAGVAALVLERNPEYTPDQVKDVLIDSAASFKKVSEVCQGAGKIWLHDTWWETPDQHHQTHTDAVGTGSLEDARGSDHLEIDGVTLEGEQDIFGNPWDGSLWAELAAQGTSWSGGDWNGTSWSGTSWSGLSWSGLSWSGTSWSGTSWSGTSWSGTSWSDKTWSGLSWSGTSWSGTSWSGTSWSGLSWSSSNPGSGGVRWD